MDDSAFHRWLAQRSWGLAVRYCKAVALLLPPAALATDAPMFRDGGNASLPWLLACQIATECVCVGLILVDRWAPRLRGREWPLYVFCGLFMALSAWIGIIDGWRRGDFSVYAAGATFAAAVLCTPRPVRQPMYVLSFLALAVPAWDRAGGDVVRLVSDLVNPFCVVVLCLALDRFTYSFNLALYRETQRAEAERARADAVLYNVLPASIADQLKRDGKVDAAKFENMGVLFADIAGFTSYSRGLPPHALVLVLNEIFSAFDALVDQHGLEKIKTIGDGYMVTSQQGGPALCRFALEMQQAIRRYNGANGTALSMRIGIHTGPAVAGVIGVKRFLYDVWGDTVNLASRIEAAGEPGAIHVSEAVYSQGRGQFLFEPRGPVEISGRGAVQTYWLIGRPAPVKPPANASSRWHEASLPVP